jgi:predicted molibdopterin-dependent oxidoreductase YjgC
MTDRCRIVVDGRPVDAEPGTTVLAVLWTAGLRALRRSVSGEARGALCGMGVCHECLVTVDGETRLRACLTAIRPGMTVTTGA